MWESNQDSIAACEPVIEDELSEVVRLAPRLAESLLLRGLQVNDKKAAKDRRGSDRFPIEQEVRYRTLNYRKGAEDGGGIGKTINMSSNGILFQTDQMLLPGRRVELAVNWPARLNNNCPLKLVAKAKVVRSDANSAAVEILQYEFRTQSRASLVAATPAV